MRFIKGVDFLSGGARHEGAALRERFKAGFGDKAMENLADALARNAEDRRQSVFGQLGAACQPALKHVLAAARKRVYPARDAAWAAQIARRAIADEARIAG